MPDQSKVRCFFQHVSHLIGEVVSPFIALGIILTERVKVVEGNDVCQKFRSNRFNVGSSRSSRIRSERKVPQKVQYRCAIGILPLNFTPKRKQWGTAVLMETHSMVTYRSGGGLLPSTLLASNASTLHREALEEEMASLGERLIFAKIGKRFPINGASDFGITGPTCVEIGERRALYGTANWSDA